MTRVTIIFIVIATLFLGRQTLAGDYASRVGTAEVTIANDKATLAWTVPCNPHIDGVQFHSNLKDYGGTAGDIEFVSGSSNGETTNISAGANEDHDTTIYCGKGADKATFVYTIASTLQNVGNIFEFPAYYNMKTFATSEIRVHIPPDLSLMKSSHPYKMEGSTAVIKIGPPVENYPYLGVEFFGVVLVKKTLPRGYEHKPIGPYDIYSLSRSMRLFEKIEPHIPTLDALMKKNFNTNIKDQKIVVMVANLSEMPTEYSASALALPSLDFILMDDESLYSASSNDIFNLMAHETSHILLGNSGAYDAAEFRIPWLHEGIAVFMGTYFVDTIVDSDEAKEENDALTGYPKLLFTELEEKYKLPFDYEFENSDKIEDSYSHAGLIFYKLFLDDPLIVPNLIVQLKEESYDYLCPSCNTKALRYLLSSLAGRSEDSLIYPFKGESSYPPKYKNLFRNELGTTTTKKIVKKVNESGTKYFDESIKTTKIGSVSQKPVVNITTTATSTKTEVASTTFATSSDITIPVELIGDNETDIIRKKKNLYDKITFIPITFYKLVNKLLGID